MLTDNCIALTHHLKNVMLFKMIDVESAFLDRNRLSFQMCDLESSVVNDLLREVWP